MSENAQVAVVTPRAETGCPTCGTSYIGVEIEGVYDGVLFWECAAGHRWHRWQPGSWQRDAAQPWIDAVSVGDSLKDGGHNDNR